MTAVGFAEAIEAEVCRAIAAFARLESEHVEGVTVRQFLRQIREHEDVRDRLDEDQVSDRARYLWDRFWEIKSAAANGFTNAVTWSVLADWAAVTREQLEPWEARTVIRMDAIFRRDYDSGKRRGRGGES